MPKIAVLSQHIINKIAAGEVIERPASVVKELLENSLDAGATRVQIDIEDGGKKLIRITDNGCGMEAADLALAVTPHATSKIASDDDLFSINTLGFRGEALPSIASVSHMEIISRPADTAEGARLVINGGQAEEIAPAAAAAGTTISIRNLFFNTPARRKFLRTTNTEIGHITEQFTRIAIANSHAHLTLSHNGRTLHDLPTDQPLRERIGKLFSPELTDSLIAIHREDRGIKIVGMIAPPQQSRASAQWQYLLLNGRYIRDRFVGHAIKEAYRGLMEINRSPILFLFITLPPYKVDVNVHPTKTEVRFADSNVVHSQVLAAIRDKLLGSDLRVPVKTQENDPARNDTAQREDIASRQENVRQAMADFFNKSTPAGSQHARPSTEFPIMNTDSPENIPYKQDFLSPAVSRSDRFGTSNKEYTQPETERRFDMSDSEQVVDHLSDQFLQIHNSYLVAESEDGIIIIDQHALHERLIFQQLMEQSRQGPLQSQRCLIPETLDVTEGQMDALESAKEFLENLGVLIEPFGPRTIAIQGFPMLLDKLKPAVFISDLLDLLDEQAGQVSQEQLLHKVLDMMSCRAAVKAGDKLTAPEIKNLLKQRDTVERSSNCPHGRPTTIHMSLGQLEKQFKRT